MANSNSNSTSGSAGESAGQSQGSEKSFLASAQETVAGAVDATVQAVKDHPVAAAAVAAGAAAAVGGAVYAATQLGGEKEPASKK
ncbi:hypothetical protein [Sphingomonas sp. Root241]|uniref:hypothetical protein n=1 Tax=Sphingomonas sp. Root241 TaxID=1736501 RepID=UPI0006FEA771|nr:hypothetical protein [Sphingomonas sp. Root241]KRC78298.1 hypothetical protein ASE13_18425 [Sphingomonas sp. Root241]